MLLGSDRSAGGLKHLSLKRLLTAPGYPCMCVDLASRGRRSFVDNQDYQDPRLIPSPPRHLITKFKGSTESHFCIR